MFEKIRDNFVSGIERLKWFATIFSERVRVEVSVLRLMNEHRVVESKMNDALKALGMRVFELRNQEGVDMLKDGKIKDALKDIEKLNKDMEELTHRVSEVQSEK
ncbi:MAG: hypothetical protein HY805_02720 [Nitrospirae bacterium]|nr:hypothetical protein [Nitrospirota bacterium]